MHMAWLRYTIGRLKSDYRYSIGLVYNTFPLPPQEADILKLEPLWPQQCSLLALPIRVLRWLISTAHSPCRPISAVPIGA